MYYAPFVPCYARATTSQHYTPVHRSSARRLSVCPSFMPPPPETRLTGTSRRLDISVLNITFYDLIVQSKSLNTFSVCF